MKLNERRKTTARLVLMEAQMKGRRVLRRKRPSIASGPRPKWTSSTGRSFLFGQSSSVTDAASALSLSHLRVQTTRCTAARFTLFHHFSLATWRWTDVSLVPQTAARGHNLSYANELKMANQFFCSRTNDLHIWRPLVSPDFLHGKLYSNEALLCIWIKKKKCRNRLIAVVTRGHCFSLLWLRQTFEFEISGAGKKNGRRWWPPFFFWPKKNFSFEYFSFCTKISQGLGVFDGRLGQQHFVGQFRVQQNQGNHGNPTLIHLTLIQFKFSKNWISFFENLISISLNWF